MTSATIIDWRAAGISLAFAAWPTSAEAHLVETGLGPIYDGVAHLALSPEDLVPIVGAAVLAGLRGKAHARIAILLLPIAWSVGGVLGDVLGARPFVVPSWASFMIMGGLIATDLRLPIGVTATLFVALGLVLGYPNGLAMAHDGQALQGVIGSTAAIFALTSLVAALAAALSTGWIKIAWRVIGSWIAATGLLLLGWELH